MTCVEICFKTYMYCMCALHTYSTIVQYTHTHTHVQCVCVCVCVQRRYDKRAPGNAWGGACGYNLSHDQLSSVDQHYTNCDPYKARFG